MNSITTLSTTMLFILLSTAKLHAADSISINITGKVVASPCTTVNGGSNTLNVDLGSNIQAASLLNAGSGSDMKDFDLKLTGCPASTSNVTITFTGPGDTPDITRWKNTATIGTEAWFVSVELSQKANGALLGPNSTMTEKVTSGAATFKLQARAYSKGNVKPGNIASVITATVEYQ